MTKRKDKVRKKEEMKKEMKILKEGKKREEWRQKERKKKSGWKGIKDKINEMKSRNIQDWELDKDNNTLSDAQKKTHRGKNIWYHLHVVNYKTSNLFLCKQTNRIPAIHLLYFSYIWLSQLSTLAIPKL